MKSGVVNTTVVVKVIVKAVQAKIINKVVLLLVRSSKKVIVKVVLKIEEKICSKLEVIQVWNLPLLPQHSLSDLQSKGFPQGRRHSVSNLTVLVQDGARKVEVIPEMTKFKFWSCRLSA